MGVFFIEIFDGELEVVADVSLQFVQEVLSAFFEQIHAPSTIINIAKAIPLIDIAIPLMDKYKSLI